LVAERGRITVDGKAELVAVQVVALGDLVADFHGLAVERRTDGLKATAGSRNSSAWANEKKTEKTRNRRRMVIGSILPLPSSGKRASRG
jgi:hypothetical protein